jgi:VanZ family protein
VTIGPDSGQTTWRDQGAGTRTQPRWEFIRIGAVVVLIGLTIGWFNLVPRFERSGDELLRNGRFEHALEGWTVQGPADAVSVADGTVTLALDAPGLSVGMSQTLTPGTEQRALGLSVEVATEGVTAGPKPWQRARVSLLGRSVQGKPRWNGQISPVMVSGDHSWRRYSGTFVLPAGVGEVVVRMALANASGVMRVRDVSVFPVRRAPAFRIGTYALLAAWVAAAALFLLPLVRGVRSPVARILVALVVIAILFATLIPASLKDGIFRPMKEALKVALNLVPALAPEIHRVLAVSIEHLDAYGHTMLFFVAALAVRFFRPDDRGIVQYGYLLLFAAISETLQYFTPSRTPSFGDLSSDVAGITLAFLLHWLVAGRSGKRRRGAATPRS